MSRMREHAFRAVLLVALAAMSVGACASSQGDKLMKAGSFAEAAAAYDVELGTVLATDSHEVARKRDAAREQAIRAKLDEARSVRGAGHGEAALTILGEALRLETRWSLALPADLAAARDAEIAAAADTTEAIVRPLLMAKATLVARRRTEKLAALLAHPRLVPVADKMRSEVAMAAHARCAELSSGRDGKTPHLDRLVSGYCSLLGAPTPAPPVPEQRRGLRIWGKVAGATPQQQAILEAWLGDVFRDTPWFSADAADLATLQIGGSYDARLERRRVVLNAPYHEVIRATVQQGLQTAVVETEEDHVFQYEAYQYDARYDLDATFTIELADGTQLAVQAKKTASKRALQHDVNFPKAHVYPQRAELPTVNTWLEGYLAGKTAVLIRKLRGRWVKAFCGAPLPSPEQAARCLQGGERRAAATAAVATIFGPDLNLVIDELTRAPVDAAKPTAPADKGKGAPEVEEVPAAGMESI